MGRPPIAKGKQKINFPIRFERDTIATFKKAARRAGVPVSQWVKDVLTKASK